MGATNTALLAHTLGVEDLAQILVQECCDWTLTFHRLKPHPPLPATAATLHIIHGPILPLVPPLPIQQPIPLVLRKMRAVLAPPTNDTSGSLVVVGAGGEYQIIPHLLVLQEVPAGSA